MVRCLAMLSLWAVGAAAEPAAPRLIDAPDGVTVAASPDGRRHLVVAGHGRDWTLVAGGGEAVQLPESDGGGGTRTAFRFGREAEVVASGTVDRAFERWAVADAGGFVGARRVRPSRTGWGPTSPVANEALCAFDDAGAVRWCDTPSFEKGIDPSDADVRALWIDSSTDAVVVEREVGWPKGAPGRLVMDLSERLRAPEMLSVWAFREGGAAPERLPEALRSRFDAGPAAGLAAAPPSRVRREWLFDLVATIRAGGRSAPLDLLHRLAQDRSESRAVRTAAAFALVEAEHRHGLPAFLSIDPLVADLLAEREAAGEPDGPTSWLAIAATDDLWRIRGGVGGLLDNLPALAESLERQPHWVEEARTRQPGNGHAAAVQAAVLAVAGAPDDVLRILEWMGPTRRLGDDRSATRPWASHKLVEHLVGRFPDEREHIASLHPEAAAVDHELRTFLPRPSVREPGGDPEAGWFVQAPLSTSHLEALYTGPLDSGPRGRGLAIHLRPDLDVEVPRSGQRDETRATPGFVAVLANHGATDIHLFDDSGVIEWIQQAWIDGRWRDVEDVGGGFCGNAQGHRTLPAGSFWELPVRRFEGPQPARLRVVVGTGEHVVVASEPFDGAIDPGQLVEPDRSGFVPMPVTDE